MTLDAQVRAVATEHGWSFEKSWEFLQATQPALFSAGKDPRLAQEIAKHGRLADTRQSGDTDIHTARLAKIRKLMTEKNLSFDAAFSEICRVENAAKTAPASAAHTLTFVPVATPATGDDENDLQRCEAHPGQAAATAKGLLLIEGGFYTPLQKKK